MDIFIVHEVYSLNAMSAKDKAMFEGTNLLASALPVLLMVGVFGIRVKG